MSRPRMVFADEKGNVYDHPELEMACRSGARLIAPDEEHLIPMPPHTRLYTMPGRMPVGWDRRRKRYEAVDEMAGMRCYPVAALLPPGYVRTLLPGTALCDISCILPLWAYTAVGWREDGFWVAAAPVDLDERWNPDRYDTDELPELVERRLGESPENRLLRHLARCALEYSCFTAQNVFYRRWECGLPTSPACNARCVGCISRQPPERCSAPQERISFIPTLEEILEIAVPHLREAEGAIVSFGQGCEGEPLLQAELIAEAIKRIRKETDRGTINMNTNASLPKAMEMVCEAGLDSVRVSINSARGEFYERYYRPQGYSFEDVVESIKIAKSRGLFVSINLLVFPGFTDCGDEMWALIDLLRETKADMVQLRNLNIDPELYLRTLDYEGGPGVGIRRFMETVREEVPWIKFGCFNRPRESLGRR